MLPGAGVRAWGLSTLSVLGAGGWWWGRKAGRVPQHMASTLQPPQDDAAIVGAVRLFAVMIAALTMDRAGRKVLLFVSGEPPPPPAAARGCAPQGGSRVAGLQGLGWDLPRAQGPARTGCPRGLLGCERTARRHSLWVWWTPEHGGASSLEVTSPRGL